MLRAVMLLVCVCAAVVTGAAARQDNGNFLDDKWLTARWDKFRDVSYAFFFLTSPSASGFLTIRLPACARARVYIYMRVCAFMRASAFVRERTCMCLCFLRHAVI